MTKLIFVSVFLCFISCTQKAKIRPITYEVKLALEVLELTRDIEYFPEYEKKQIREKLIEVQKYIMKQITDRIDKHPIGDNTGGLK